MIYNIVITDDFKARLPLFYRLSNPQNGGSNELLNSYELRLEARYLETRIKFYSGKVPFRGKLFEKKTAAFISRRLLETATLLDEMKDEFNSNR
jgi:hypothetical protein